MQGCVDHQTGASAAACQHMHEPATGVSPSTAELSLSSQPRTIPAPPIHPQTPETRHRSAALDAIQHRHASIQGPFLLKQGFTGIIVRLPVYKAGVSPDETFESGCVGAWVWTLVVGWGAACVLGGLALYGL